MRYVIHRLQLFFYNGEYNSTTLETINVYGIENEKAVFLFSDAIPLDDIKLGKSKTNNDQFYFCKNGKMGWLHDYRIEREGLIPMYHYNIDEDKYYLGHVGEINFFSNEITHKEYITYFQNLDVSSINVIKHYFSAESSKDEIIMQLKKANEVFRQGIQLVDRNKDKVTMTNLESGAAVLTYTPDKGNPRKIEYIMDDVTYYGGILYHDIDEDGIDEIIVNLYYVGSTYGVTDVYIYSIVNDELMELVNLTQDNISNYNKDFYACAGASILENNLIVSICTYSNTEPVDYCLLYIDDKWELVNYKN